MNAQQLRMHPILVIAGIAVTIFALTGTAAIMGWLPKSHSEQTAESTVAEKPAPAVEKKAVRTEHTHKPVQVAATCGNCGTVKSVNLIEKKGDGSGVGAVAGGVAGGLLGNMIGKGDGKTVATVAGVAGGAYAGHQVEKTVRSTKYYDISVRMDDGEVRHFQQNTNPGLAVGERVKIVDGVIRQQS